MEGLIELAEEIFHMPVSLGAPRCGGFEGHRKEPVYATSVGLLQYGLEREQESADKQSSRKSSMFDSIRNWFRENF